MAIEGPGRFRARRESRRCCPEARRPPHPGSPTPAPQGWRHRAAPARARLSSPSGALRSRRLQPAGSGSTSSTRPSTSDLRLSRLFTHMRIHARCSVFRVAMFRPASLWLCRSIYVVLLYFSGWVDGFTPLLTGAAVAAPSAAGSPTGCGRIVDARKWHRRSTTPYTGVMQALKRPQKEKVKQFCVFTGAK